MATPAGLVVEHQTPDPVVPGSIPGGAVEFLRGRGERACKTKLTSRVV